MNQATPKRGIKSTALSEQGLTGIKRTTNVTMHEKSHLNLARQRASNRMAKSKNKPGTLSSQGKGIHELKSKAISILLSLLIFAFVVALLIESSRPPLPIFGEVEGLDKVAHFLAFSALGVLACVLSFTISPKPAIPLFSIPLLIVTLSGIIEESYQMFVPGRAASLLDLLADVCGALCAIFLVNRVALLMRTNNPVSSE
jgi:VanZ family protein